MKTRDYEAMFLLDNTAATEDFDGTAGQVDAILEKHGVQIVQKGKWDERKLAYEIRGQRRATYYLVYFRAPTAAIREIRQDIALNQVVLRHLVIALDLPIEQHIKLVDEDREKLAEDSRKTSLTGWGERKGRDRDRDRGGRRRSDDDDSSDDEDEVIVSASSDDDEN
jgi:small subunit ribosomal protein S6